MNKEKNCLQGKKGYSFCFVHMENNCSCIQKLITEPSSFVIYLCFLTELCCCSFLIWIVQFIIKHSGVELFFDASLTYYKKEEVCESHYSVLIYLIYLSLKYLPSYITLMENVQCLYFLFYYLIQERRGFFCPQLRLKINFLYL